MGAPGQASVKADVVKLLEGEKAKLVQNPPSGGFQKKCILLERMMGIVRQYEGAIQSPADVDSLPGATIEMKKRFKKLLDEVLNPGYLPKWGSGGHALLVAMLKAKQVRTNWSQGLCHLVILGGSTGLRKPESHPVIVLFYKKLLPFCQHCMVL